MTSTASDPGLNVDCVFAELRDAVAIVCEVDPATLALTTRLDEDLAADSLALVEIIDITESALAERARPGFRFDDAELDRLFTLGDLVDHALEADKNLPARA